MISDHYAAVRRAHGHLPHHVIPCGAGILALIDIPTPTADEKTDTGLAERLVETAKAFGRSIVRSFCARIGGRHVGN